MSRKILTLLISFILLLSSTTSVFAIYDDFYEHASEKELTEIQAALDDSNVVRGVNSPRYGRDDSGEEVVRKTEKVKPYAGSAIRMYAVSIREDTASLAEQLGKENEIWLLPERKGKKIIFFKLVKGKDADDAIKGIENLDVADSLREKIIENAKNRAGKWYVQSAFEPSKGSYEDYAIPQVDKVLKENDITNVKSIKYITNIFEMDGVWVQTDDAEYVIPYFTTQRTFGLERDTLYTLSDFIEHLFTQGDVYMTFNDDENVKKSGNEKINTKKDTEKEPDKKTDDKEDNKKDDQKDTERKTVNDTDVKKDDSDKPGEIKKPTGKTPDVTFSDVPKDHWAYNDITSLAEKSVILGYGDGKFGVDDSVTHEQLSLLLKRQFNYDETDRAAQPAKREDIIVSLVKALNADLSSVDTADVSKFSDADSISADDEQYIAYAVKSGLVLGYDGRLNLADNVTRAETAALICRAMKLAK